MEHVSLAKQFDEFIERSKFASKNDWDNFRVQQEYIKMLKEEPLVPIFMDVRFDPDDGSMDV